jgi:PAS domain S-box-containing protein
MNTPKSHAGRRPSLRLLLSVETRKEAVAWLRELRAAGLKITPHIALGTDEIGLRLVSHVCDLVITSRNYSGQVGRVELDILTLLDQSTPVIAVLPAKDPVESPVKAAKGIAEAVPSDRPDLLTAVVRRMAVERDLRMEQSRRAEAHQDRVRLAALSRDVGIALTRSENLAGSLAACADALVKHLDASLARIWSHDPEAHELRLCASAGLLDPEVSKFEHIPIGQFGVGHVAEIRKPYLTNQILGDPRVGAQDWLQTCGIASFAGYPLMIGDTVVGVVAMFSRTPLTGFTINALSSVADEIALELGRKRTERALEAAEARFHLLAQNLPGVFWLSDCSRSVFHYVSPGFERVFGQPVEVLNDSAGYWHMAVCPEDRAKLQEAVAKPWGGEEGVEVEYRITRPDGSHCWVRDRAFPIRDPDGVVRRVAGITEDITRHKQLETQFLQAQKMQNIGRLAGGVAHDFNNLLTAIGSYAQMAFDKLPAGSQARSDLEGVLMATTRATKLTSQLMAFARMQTLAPVVMDPNEHLVNLSKMLSRLVREDTELSVRPGAGVGLVRIDPAQFQQILVNLVVNAAQAVRSKGLITIETTNERLSDPPARRDLAPAPGDYVVILVADNGCGMSENVQAHLFEPYFTTKKVGEGSGFGLSTVYGIVKQSGGYISVQSAEGQGSTFRILLPKLEGTIEHTSESPCPTRQQGGQETILVVEDDPRVREVVVKVLRSRGYTVMETFDGVQALDQVRDDKDRRIDLVLTDLVMPKLGGLELADELLLLRPSLPVICMSGYSDEAASGDLYRSTDLPFLQKPFTPEQLLQKIRDVFDASRENASPSGQTPS